MSNDELLAQFENAVYECLTDFRQMKTDVSEEGLPKILRGAREAVRSAISNEIEKMDGNPNNLLTLGEFSNFATESFGKVRKLPPQPDSGSLIEWGEAGHIETTSTFQEVVKLYERKLEELARSHDVQLDSKHSVS